jgi:hypothetical protein
VAVLGRKGRERKRERGERERGRERENFSSWLRTFFNFISIIMNYRYNKMGGFNTKENINNLFTLFKSTYYIYFSSLLIACHWFFTWTAVSDDLHFSFMLVRKANSVDKETTWAARLHRQCNSYKWLMVWCHFLLASCRRNVQPWIIYAKPH